jgi:hypothetical protein
MMTDHQRLVSELTRMDDAQQVRDRKKGYRTNPYALALMFQAAQEVEQEVAAGRPFAEAFADHFTPTRGMHTIAKRLGLPLDVVRGQWAST